MSKSSLALTLDPNTLREMVTAQISAQVAAAFSSQSEHLTEALLGRILAQKVDEHGRPCSYSSSKPYVEQICESAVKDAAKEAVIEWIADNKAAIKAEILRLLGLKRVRSQLAQQMIDGVTATATGRWGLKVSLVPPKDDE